MKYKVYIQAFNNFPIADWAVSAYMGFREKQMDIIFFEDIESVPVSKNNIIVAYIEETNKYLEKLGLAPKMALNIPEALLEAGCFTGREITYSTMGEFKNDMANGDIPLPIFIKPNGRSKEFIAGVMERKETIFAFDKIPDESPVLLSTVVNFISEYRCYIIDGQIKGIKHYMGDFRIFPDFKVIDACLASYKDAPAGYSMDFGITDGGKTLLIECNDGWALGNYGLNDVTYSTLLTKRWIELTKNI